MNITLSTNMIYYILVIVVVGKAIKPLIKKNRKTVLPLILMLVGVFLAVLIDNLNGCCELGNSVLQGLISSIVAQYGFDKVKDFASKGLNNV